MIQVYLQEDVTRNLRKVAKQIKLHEFKQSNLHKINLEVQILEAFLGLNWAACITV